MFELDITADELVSSLLHISSNETVCILDSCGVGHLGSHLLIAGIEPLETIEITNEDISGTLRILDEKFSSKTAAIFTLSYDFGQKMQGVERSIDSSDSYEPDVFAAIFDVLVVHDYNTGISKLTGNSDKFAAIKAKLETQVTEPKFQFFDPPAITSNFSRQEYLFSIETIKELIQSGDTYQTNLTQQLKAQLPKGLKPETLFQRLRKDHPAPFSAYIKRKDSIVVSASPERFFKIDGIISQGDDLNTYDGAAEPYGPGIISTSPIKGTRPRGKNAAEDALKKKELLNSQKDIAENTMIVDLLRNDLGRVCKFGSVKVEQLCELEEHPTLFHLVSTISGELNENMKPSEILNALFPCGSITGAPKISTMQIIDKIEPDGRGLSMGAIGYYAPREWNSDLSTFDLSVAIRTMVIRNNIATFNVGGGIVIDSEPGDEYAETLAKARALLNALDADLDPK